MQPGTGGSGTAHSLLSQELAIAPGGDIRIYRLCADCYGASLGLGELEEGTGGEPWILV